MDNINTQTKRIQMVTSKGQITLPVSWRKKFNVNQIIVSSKGDALEIRSVNLAADNSEMTVFDAIRDNKGKGLKAKDLLKILKRMGSKVN